MIDAKHPAYSLGRLAVLMIAMCFVLWVNATEFDNTEIASLVQMFLVASGVEGGIQTMQRWKK